MHFLGMFFRDDHADITEMLRMKLCDISQQLLHFDSSIVLFRNFLNLKGTCTYTDSYRPGDHVLKEGAAKRMGDIAK
jgi:hypothetical protein